MPNPGAGGEIQPYREVWRRLPINQDSVDTVILESDDGKSFIGRVGNWEIGLSEGVTFLAIRRDQKESSGWAELYCIGGEEARRALPPIPENFDREPGVKVELGDQMWRVQENSPKYPSYFIAA